ncbi:uncharacterized protein LOC120340019 [Styela clava]
MLVHVADAAASGYSSILMRTVDTDVVALAVAVVNEVEVSALWIMFGTGNNPIPIHRISKKLEKEKSQSLPLFHALTGCDTTSFFLGNGKKRAWTTWENLPDLTKMLLSLLKLEGTSDVPAQCMQMIERFIVLLYDRTSMLSKVIELRHHLFTIKGKMPENIPPTSNSLLQHIRKGNLPRCIYLEQSNRGFTKFT